MNKFLVSVLLVMILLGGCNSAADNAPARYMLSSDAKFNLTHDEYFRYRDGAMRGSKEDANVMMRFHLQKSAFTEEFPMLPVFWIHVAATLGDPEALRLQSANPKNSLESALRGNASLLSRMSGPVDAKLLLYYYHMNLGDKNEAARLWRALMKSNVDERLLKNF